MADFGPFLSTCMSHIQHSPDTAKSEPEHFQVWPTTPPQSQIADLVHDGPQNIVIFKTILSDEHREYGRYKVVLDPNLEPQN